MGRGLSPQQRAILGAAVAVNAHLNGGAPVARAGVVELPSPERYRVPILWTIEPPDITLPLAVHLAGKVPIARTEASWCTYPRHFTRASGTNFRRTPETKSTYNSISRALSQLSVRGLIVWKGTDRHGAKEPISLAPVDFWDRNTSKMRRHPWNFRGYCLTAEGLAIGVAAAASYDDLERALSDLDECTRALIIENFYLLVKYQRGTVPTVKGLTVGGRQSLPIANDYAEAVSVGDIPTPKRRQPIDVEARP